MNFEGSVSVSQVAYLGHDAARYYTSEHANRGTMIHSLCTAHLNMLDNNIESEYLGYANRDRAGKALSFYKGEVDSWEETCRMYGYEGYVESAKLMFDNLEFVPILTEKRLYHYELKLTGKPDFIGFCYGIKDKKITPKSEVGIIDFKTSVNYQKEWALQLSGYWALCLVNGIRPSWAASVRIRSNGKKPLVDIVLDDSDYDNVQNSLKVFVDKVTEYKLYINA